MPQKIRSSDPGYTLARTILIPWLHNFFRWHLEGLHHIPRSGPAIIAVNHISYFDPLAVAYALDRVGRRPRFLAKSTLFDAFFVGWVLRTAKQIPVARGTAGAPSSLIHAEEALEAGEIVAVFPEGTVSRKPDLTPLDPKSGISRLALRTGLPVIPCGTWGGQWIWGPHRGFRPGLRKDVWIRFGRPVSFEEFEGSVGDPAAWASVSRQVMDEIAILTAGMLVAKPWDPVDVKRMPKALR